MPFFIFTNLKQQVTNKILKAVLSFITKKREADLLLFKFIGHCS